MAFGYFDATKGQTPESIARTRALVEALMGPRRAPANTGDGLMALGDGIVANVMNRRANESEAAGLEDWNTNFGSLLSGDSLMGSAASSGVAGEMAATSPGSSMPASGSSVLPGSLMSALDSTEGAGAYDTLYGHAQRQGPFAGVDVSKMTVGEAMAFADPSGPYAQHVKGQIGRVATPMGRHQIVGTTLRNAVGELGIDPSTPFDSNTQDMVASHLARQRIASADTLDGKISALRSEWHGLRNVPRQQMAQIVADLENGQQVASLDPSAGMASAPEAIEAVAPGSGAIAPQQPAFDAGRFGDPINLAEMPANAAQMPSALIDQGANYAPPLPPQTNVEALPVASVAEALAAPPVEMAQAGGGSMPAAQGGRPSVAQLLAAANHPFAPKSAQGVIGALLEQEMKRNDPMTQMQLQKAQIELQRLQNPGPDGVSVGNRIVDRNTGKVIYEAQMPPTAPELETLYDDKTGLEYKARWNPETQQYERVGGTKMPSGTSLSVGPNGEVSFTQGGAQGKPFTEGQSKDNVYSTRARGSLPTANEYADYLADFGDRVMDSDPTGVVRGNFQNPDYQIARTAADEFLQAILRKDTGAAITEQEQTLYGRTYFPAPGDGPAVREYKKQARERAVAAIESGMSATQMVAQERALAKSSGLDLTGSGRKAGTEENPLPPQEQKRRRFNPQTGRLE